jgi:tagatose 6-phosphate kinase
MAESLSQSEFDMVIVGPNAAIDSYYSLSELEVGVVNRARQALHTAGGKGINMARALSVMGGKPYYIGIVGGYSGRFVRDELDREGIAHGLFWTSGETRRCSTWVVPETGQTTVVLDPGSAVSDETGFEFLKHVQSNSGKAPFLTLTGSLLTGLPYRYYANIIQAVNSIHEVKICIDSSGNTLNAAATSGANVIKVNYQEFQTAFGGPDKWDWQAIEHKFNLLHENGLEILVVTNGPRGAYVFSCIEKPFRVFTPIEKWVNTAGAGDTFMAGMLFGLMKGQPLKEAAKYASSVATAQLQHIVCGYFNPDETSSYMNKTEIEALR